MVVAVAVVVEVDVVVEETIDLVPENMAMMVAVVPSG